MTTIAKKPMRKRIGKEAARLSPSVGSNDFDETTYLLKSPANAEHLRKSIADLNAGKGIEVRLEDL